MIRLHEARCTKRPGEAASDDNPEEQALREKAKALGIKNWHNKGLDKLLVDIEEAEKAVI